MNDTAVLDNIRQQLMDNSNDSHKQFIARRVHNVPIENIMGVRAADITKIARGIDKESELIFRTALPHQFYEENILHAHLLSKFDKDDDLQTCIDAIEQFLPFVDNWAVCDAISPKLFARHPKGLEDKLCEWLRAERPYTIRFALNVMMKHYLDEFFDEEHFQWVMDISSNSQYVQTAQALYFSTALTKRYEQTVALLENDMLDPKVKALTRRRKTG